MLHLHVGIHKTASTAIQHRLQAQQALLAEAGLWMPRRRRQHMVLVRALRQGHFEPWANLLDQAAERGCQPLISAEVLSLDLARPLIAHDPESPSRLSWLRQHLQQCGVRLAVVAFVRDQPAYLNSRYTQLIKRLYFAKPFEGYVEGVLSGRQGESCCDYRQLFAEALEDPAIEATFLPFPGNGSDPSTRLLAALGHSISLPPLPQETANSQPGWRTVWLARWMARRLRRHHPEIWRQPKLRRRLRRRLDRLAQQQGWPAEPFVGLAPALQQRIETHYAASNDWFAQRAWGCSWRDRLPPTPAALRRSEPGTAAERRQLVALGKQLLSDVVRQSVSRRP